MSKYIRVNTQTNAYREAFKTHLLTWIDFDPVEDGNEHAKLDYLYSEFVRVADYPANVHKYPSVTERLADYLSGLPINLPYLHTDILAFTCHMHDDAVLDDLSETDCDNITDQWFTHVAMQIMHQWRKHGITD